MSNISLSEPGVETDDSRLQQALRANGSIPRHIAMIMDGNGRWAKQQGKTRVAGHYEGVESVRDISEACAEIGVDYLTLYTFSTENWNRPAREVNALMKLLIHTIRKERKTLVRNQIRLKAIGALDKLPRPCLEELNETMEYTSHLDRMTLVLALSYSGRWDIQQATQKIAHKVQQGLLDPDEITEQTIQDHLSTTNYPDPELLIRTGGELRVSNFLLWQMSYSEMYLTDRFWPEFRRPQLYKAIESYQNRDRRFGRVKP